MCNTRFTIVAGIPSAPVAFLMFISFKILSTFSFVTLLNSKSGTCSLLFNISLILGWFEESYTTSIPILSATVEKKILE
jgi:hypothetical protein